MFRPLVATSLLLLLVGCGGKHSSEPSASPTVRARTAQTFAGLQNALGNSRWALEFNALADVPTGIDPDFPPNVGDPALGTPEDPPTSFYYNDSIGAWEQITDDEGSYREDYYADEAKTEAIGFYAVNFTTQGDATSETGHYEFSGGAYAGARGDDTQEFRASSDGSNDYWHSSYLAVSATGITYRGEFTYQGDALASTASTTYADGTEDSLHVAFAADDSGTLTFESHLGTNLSVTFAEDGVTAKGTLKGIDDDLSGDVVLDASGKITVRFSDGSRVEYGSARSVHTSKARKLGFPLLGARARRVRQ